MGALLSRISESKVKKKRAASRENSVPLAAAALRSSRRWSKGRSGRKGSSKEALPLERSSSMRCQRPALKKEAMARSSSSRSRSLADPLVQPHQLVGQDLKIEELETGIIVLVHGGGFGAWCWYKTTAYLEECGFRVIALDLAASGVDSADPNYITNLAQYSKPLLYFLGNLLDDEKAILVGHDLGGTCISSAMEKFPSKIAKAVFVAAPMLKNGQSTRHFLSPGADGLTREAQEFIYVNGADQPPTAVAFKKSTLKELLFNQSPNKDIALASVSMRAVPFAPLLEKLSLSRERYGSMRRFYIKTTEDNCIFLSLQRAMCSVDPPERVFRVNGADHSPFFSKPWALHKLLVEIAKV